MNKNERINEIEIMAILEEVQGNLDDIKEAIEKQNEAIELAIQKLMNGGDAV